jgi:hypothetical protein
LTIAGCRPSASGCGSKQPGNVCCWLLHVPPRLVVGVAIPARRRQGPTMAASSATVRPGRDYPDLRPPARWPGASWASLSQGRKRLGQ